MTPEAIGMIGMGCLILLILLRVPIAVALGLVGFVGYAAISGWARAGFMVGGVPLELASAYSLSVVPLFALMGAVASSAGLSTDLFRACNLMLRGARGSLAVASIFASALFGAVCGSSVATALTMSRVSIPEMLRAGYPHTVAAGAVAAGGTLGILIPPSLILMIYAIIAQQSVAKLFAAALLPGLVLMAFYVVVAVSYYRWSVRHTPEAAPAASAPTEPLLRAVARIWHVVALFGVTLGGIYLGWFTPTEAAAVGAFGAILLGLLLRRQGIADTVRCFNETIRMVSSLLIVVMGSSIFSYFIVQTGLSNHITAGVKASGLGGKEVMLLLCVVYILLGCFLEGIGMMLVTVPIVLPLILSYGYDPVWFGVLLVILVEIGLVHPPLGMNLFVIKAVQPEIGIFDIYKGTLPFLIAPLALILVIIFYPGLVLWLPSRMD
jgi:tripartite ATP-independent transporter DctM subunit